MVEGLARASSAQCARRRRQARSYNLGEPAGFHRAGGPKDNYLRPAWACQGHFMPATPRSSVTVRLWEAAIPTRRRRGAEWAVCL
eukprot:7202956-Alexandrium_andersonii.AAC.1